MRFNYCPHCGEKLIKKELKKATNKLDNLRLDLETAKKNTKYSNIGIKL